MILTVTLNPSVDISYKLTQLALDDVNRVTDVSKTAGGKGLNVSRVLKQLNETVGAMGFLGGSLGGFIHSELVSLNVQDYFIDIDGPTRNCIAVIHDDGKQTEILEGGPTILEAEANEFLQAFENATQKAELITISGSLPQGISKSFYNQLLTIAKEQKTPVLLDTGGALLEKALNHSDKPFLIKPNETEIADLLGKPINDQNELIEALNHSMFSSVEWIVVTLGSKGALAKHQERIFRVSIPKVKAVNPVGSGDSVIAGLAAGLSRKLSEIDFLKFSSTMGVLNAMEEKTGHINPDKIDWCMEQIQVEEITQSK